MSDPCACTEQCGQTFTSPARLLYLQASRVKVVTRNGQVTKFIAGGDYDAKNTSWGFGTKTTARGR